VLKYKEKIYKSCKFSAPIKKVDEEIKERQKSLGGKGDISSQKGPARYTTAPLNLPKK